MFWVCPSFQLLGGFNGIFALKRVTFTTSITRAVSWLTLSRQLVISWLGVQVSCSGANYPTIFLCWVSLFVGRLASYGARISPRHQEPTCAANIEVR